MKGVEILLFSGIMVPKWLRFQSKFVSIENLTIKGHKVRSLTIRNGKAILDPDFILLKTPATAEDDDWVVAFKTSSVLLFRELKSLARRKYFACDQCDEFLKEIIDGRLKNPASSDLIIFKCRLCHNQWLINGD